MNDSIKIVQALEDSNILLLKGVTKTIENNYVTRYSRCKFIRKFIDWKRN